MLDQLASTLNKISTPKPKPTSTKSDVIKNLLIFEIEIQELITSLKQASQEISNPVSFDSLWERFRKWLNSETQKLEELSYERAQQKFSEQLKAFKDQVLSHWDKKEILLLKNAPWKEHHPSDVTEPDSDSHSLTTALENMIAT